jgi:O-succinylbenzoic acid--CoA ligase
MENWLTARASVTPDQVALIADDVQITYAALAQQVNDYQYRLASIGVRAGQHIGVLLPNSPDAVALIHALAGMRAVIVPLNLRLAPDEMHWQLRQANCEMLLCTSETQPQAIAIEIDLPVHSINKIVPSDKPPTLQSVDLNATQAIVFTSGTSGNPKGVEITFGNHFYSAMASAYRLGLNPDDRWLSILPLYHVGGLAVIFRSTLYGITTVLHDTFDIEIIQHSFDHQKITIISLVPTMLYRMLEADVRWPDSLRLILLGGAAASPALLERAWSLALPVATTYGLTEATSQEATATLQQARRKPGSVGKPLLFISVRVVNENGEPMPAGEYGEVQVKGPTVMKGYYNNPAANNERLKGGWLSTGDIGYLDDDGDLWLIQRRSDLIVSGGENVYPAEIEQLLSTHPAVKVISVVGIDDAEWGQRVVAAVVLQGGATLDVDALIAYGREHLAGYKLPKQIQFVDKLPQTASGKIQRGQVRALFE